MAVTNKQKQKIFKKAHSLFKSNENLPFSYALKLAWSAFRLQIDMLDGNIVEFEYYKKDGSLRKASGTRPSKTDPDWRFENIFCYYDTDCGEFRSFKFENLKID